MVSWGGGILGAPQKLQQRLPLLPQEQTAPVSSGSGRGSGQPVWETSSLNDGQAPLWSSAASPASSRMRMKPCGKNQKEKALGLITAKITTMRQAPGSESSGSLPCAMSTVQECKFHFFFPFHLFSCSRGGERTVSWVCRAQR